MEDEKFICGYCRQSDCSRTVTAEIVDGKLENTDCGYGSCPYQGNCTIAKQLDELNQ